MSENNNIKKCPKCGAETLNYYPVDKQWACELCKWIDYKHEREEVKN